MNSSAEGGSVWPTEAERELIADGCRSDFYCFVKYAYGLNYNPKGKWFTPNVHKLVCDWFQRHIEDWEARRWTDNPLRQKLMAVWPRGCAKTILLTKAGQLWLHLRNPDLSTYTDSESSVKSEEFLESNLRIMEGRDPYAMFTWLYGVWYDKSRKWTASKAVHAFRKTMSLSEPSFGTTGVEKGITGKHPDATFLDDPISAEKLRDEGNWLDIVNRHLIAIIPATLANGLLVYIGTIYADGDAITTTIQTEGLASITGMDPRDIGFDLSPNGTWHLFYWDIEDDNGNTTLPKCWSNEELAAYKARDLADYMRQMRNRPTVGEHMPIQRHDVKDIWITKEDIPISAYATVHMDTAFNFSTRKSRGDYNVIEAWVHFNDGSGIVCFVGAVWSRDWKDTDFGRQLISFVEQVKAMGWYVRAMTDENEPGGKTGLWFTTLKNWFHQAEVFMPRYVMVNRQTTMHTKETRKLKAAAYWTNGFVRLLKDAKGADRLVDQALRVGTKMRWDDFFDASIDVFDERIYRPARSQLRGPEPMYPERPEDNVLIGSHMTGRILFSDSEIVRAREQAHAEEGYIDGGRPPIRGEGDRTGFDPDGDPSDAEWIPEYVERADPDRVA